MDTAPVEEMNRDDKSVHLALSQAKLNSVIINFKPLRLDFYVGRWTKVIISTYFIISLAFLYFVVVVLTLVFLCIGMKYNTRM